MFSSSPIALISLLAAAVFPAVHGHAAITSPPIRSPGQKFLSTCGKPSFDSVTSDPTGHIEEQTPFSAGCEPTLCRGMLFSDQPASNVQQVKPGQSLSMGVDCTIPHGGPANVSLIDTTGGGAGQFVGSFLKTFDDFCPTSGKTPADQTNLQFTLPQSDVVGDKCQKAGDCVVQLFWATPDFSQNYYYCVDVQMPSNAAVAAPASSSAASVSVAAVTPSPTSAVAASSNAASATTSTPGVATSGLAATSAVSQTSAASATPVSSAATSSSSDAASSSAAVSASSASSAASAAAETTDVAAAAAATPTPSPDDAASPATPTLVMVTITSFAPIPTAAAANSNSTAPGSALGSGAGRQVRVPAVFAILRLLLW